MSGWSNGAGCGELLVQVDPDLEDLVPEFLERRGEDVGAIAEALPRGDFEAVRILGHNMKGTGAAYGFDEVSRIGAAMELRAREGDRAALHGLVEELSGYLSRVRVVTS